VNDRELAIAAYHEAILRAAEYGDPEIDRLLKRRLAKEDLFFLLVYVLGRADLNRDWYFERCREVQAAPNGYLDLWGREHGKSSLITFGLTIQDILNDPEITVGIFSYSRPIAKAFLRQIKTEFETNEMLRSLFPDILWANPQRDSPKFSEDDGIIVRRKGNPKESTVEAWGLVDSTPVSKHFRLMVYDDVVTGESVSTPVSNRAALGRAIRVRVVPPCADVTTLATAPRRWLPSRSSLRSRSCRRAVCSRCPSPRSRRC